MSVYVDDAFIPYRRGMLMSHMMADTTEELDKMADSIGLNRRWIQHAGSWKEHYDICKSKRMEAIGKGAIPVTQWVLNEMIRLKRAKHWK